MKGTLTVYRVLATIVGVSIIVLVLIGTPLNELHRVNPAWFEQGSTLQSFGEDISKYLGTAHGFIYMGFVFVAFVLSRQARWSIVFTIVTLLSGTIPFLSFWAEHRATQKVQALLEDAERAGAPTA